MSTADWLSWRLPDAAQDPPARTRPAVEVLHHRPTGSLTYLLYDRDSGAAAILDPVLDFEPATNTVATDAADELLARVRALGLTVEWSLETHAHADHLSAGAYLRERLGCRTAIGARIAEVQRSAVALFGSTLEVSGTGAEFDRLWHDGEQFALGALACSVLPTPGHTPDSVTYLCDGVAFVGDALFLPDVGTARCDFPGGSADVLFESIQQLYRLPPPQLLLVGHDYPPTERPIACASTIALERAGNVHLNGATAAAEFVAFRHARDQTLPLPRFFVPSLRTNVRAGQFSNP